MDDLSGFEDANDNLDNGNDKPFDDSPFDAGVEADEVSEPEKYIQQLAGKLGTTLRTYSNDRGKPDFDLEKFAVNSVISATHTAEMDEEDQNDIIAKVKSSGVDGEDDSEGGLDNGEQGVEKPDMGGDESDDNEDELFNELNEVLRKSEKKSIFVENNMMSIIMNKLEEMNGETLDPVTKPVTTPTITPSPRKKRIWEVKPSSKPKPKA